MRAVKLLEATDDLTNSRRYVAALIILQAKAPVHYSVLIATEVIWTSKIPTAGTDGIYVYINPDFFRGVASDSQRAFLLAHEVSHIILRHPQRGDFYRERGFFRAGQAFDPSLYNRAADYVINADCITMGLEPIPEGCYSQDYGRDDIVDNVYSALAQPKDPEGDQSGDQSGDQKGDQCSQSGSQSGQQSSQETQQSSGSQGGEHTPDESGGSDGERLPDAEGHDHHLSPKYEGDPDEQEAAAREDEHEIRNHVDDGIEEATARGVGVSDQVREGSNRFSSGSRSDVDWRTELADLLHRAGDGGDVTWSRIHRRRYATLGVISPTHRGSLGRMGVIVDISSSVDRDQLGQFMTELSVAIDELNPRDGVVVVFTNHRVHSVHEVFSGGELLDLDIPMGGGTWMSDGVKYLNDNGLECDITLCFTDGDLIDNDWVTLGQHEVVVICDRTLHAYDARQANNAGVRTIIAEAA
jgi:predicted metal-dependent peptidase